MFFRKEVATVIALSDRNKIITVLEQQGIKVYTKTLDNFTGGLFENRRTQGTFGMDTSVRFGYKIYVKSSNYETAKKLIAAMQ